jgi:hypothetical protein
MGNPRVAKRPIRDHVTKLVMTPVITGERTMYQVTGDICVFAPDDTDDILLDPSFTRNCGNGLRFIIRLEPGAHFCPESR